MSRPAGAMRIERQLEAAQREHEENVELVSLAFELADEAARSDIECLCGGKSMRELDTTTFIGRINDKAVVARALRYLDLRGNDTIGFTFVPDPQQPHLVRFQDKP